MNKPLTEVKRSREEAEALLFSLVGSWEGENKTWFRPGELADTSPIRGKIRRLPGGSSVIYEYESSLGGDPFQGIAIIGYHEFNEQFDMAWSDAFHQRTNIMLSSGPGLERGFSVLGSYVYDVTKPASGWRTQFEIDGDRLVVSMFNIIPGVPEYLGIEAVYKRTADSGQR